MTIPTQLEILRRLIEKGTEALPWCGNLAMQKLVYLLQALYGLPLGYEFGLHHLGPYSSKLAAHLSIGEQTRFWRSWEEEFLTFRGPAKGKRFEVLDPPLPSKARDEADKLWVHTEKTISMALDQLRTMKGRDLELIATIHYLRNVQEVEEPELAKVLRILKPKFGQVEIEQGNRALRKLQASAPSV